ncbi:MAG TPA: hypothetical protein VGB50_13730 [Flavobacterium sp.]|jgi:hypothetical protein
MNNTNPFSEQNSSPSLSSLFKQEPTFSPFGKNSLFYTAKPGTVRSYLEQINKYDELHRRFSDFDFETVSLGKIISGQPPELPFFCTGRKLRIVQHAATNFQEYIAIMLKELAIKSATVLDNFSWFTEGDDSNAITLHFFASEHRIETIVCNMGSDVFDCLKINTAVDETGGFILETQTGGPKVNPELWEFKKEVFAWVERFYYSNEANLKKKYHIDRNMVMEAMDMEFKAESNYQKTVNWLDEKLGITNAFKQLVLNLRDDARTVKSYRIAENRYLPHLPDFDPIFGDVLLKALGINPVIKIEDYFFDFEQEDIERYKLIEKDVNWAYGFNAFFCGFWNALVDTLEGFVLLIPELYDICTDRAKLKVFLHALKELMNIIPVFWTTLEKWEVENSSGSVYQYEYFQTYGLTLIASLLLPLPKLGRAGSSETVFALTGSAASVLKNESLLLAYRMGLRVEKTAGEWQLICREIVLSSGTKEKVAKRLENIIEVAAKNPNIVFRLISQHKLRRLVEMKTGKGIKGLHRSKWGKVQSKLYNRNIATAEFKVHHDGEIITRNLKAYSNKNISELDGLGFSKSPNLRSGELKKDFSEVINGDKIFRFLDTESKIFREFEDLHLKHIMKELGTKSADELHIEVTLQTILDPCNVCQGQMQRFQQLYNTKIKVYSSGAKTGMRFKKLYPKNIVNPKNKKHGN